MALKNIRRVVKEKRRLANLEKSLGKDCQTQLKARAPANISERLSQVDVIFSALCGIDISTWPKQPPFYYHLYTRAFLKALKTWLFVWGRAEENHACGLGTKGRLSTGESGSEKRFLQGVSLPRWERNVGSNRTALPEIQGCNFEETPSKTLAKPFRLWKYGTKFLESNKEGSCRGCRKRTHYPYLQWESHFHTRPHSYVSSFSLPIVLPFDSMRTL